MIQFYLTNTGYTSEQIAAEEGLILDASSMTAVGFAKKGNTKLTVTLPFMRLAHSLENLDSSDAVALSQKGAKDMYVDLQSQISAAQSGVSSVGLSVPTGLEVSGSPITSSGTLSVTMTDGYSIPLDASLDNFQRAYVALHTHENKTILDSITDSSFHTHSNKSVLDGITSTDINNFVDASNARHTHANKGILDGLTDTSISNWNTAYSWGNHANGGYAQQSYVLDVSTRLDGAITRIADVSTYAINVSSYAADVSSRLSTTITRVGDVSSYSIDVSSRLATVDTTLSTRIANVSTYAINVSTYAANTSTRLAVTDTNVSNVSTYAANVSTYAANVSTNTNSRIANVSTYASNVSTNLYNLKNDVSVLEQIWAAAWNQLRALNPSLNVPSTPY